MMVTRQEESTMKRLVVMFVVLSGITGLATAQTVVGSKHDLGVAGLGNTPEVCVYCHSSHQATTADKQDPLWNHTLQALATTYGVYANPGTLNAVPAEIGGVAAGLAPTSFLCMSCHDGTVAPSSLYNDPNSVAPTAIPAIVGNSNLGTDLTDDHPINFDYTGALAGADGGLVTPDSTSSVDAGGLIPLFGGTGSLQCASCHDVHDPTNTPFLRVSNTDSGLCTSCHNK
jgi:predicted CXXCH cytochrome family protein